MKKRTVDITIEVDMDSEEVKEWKYPNQYFQNEVDEALEELTSMNGRGDSKYQSSEGYTQAGSHFKIVVKKS